MSYSIVTLSASLILGIGLRTNNIREMENSTIAPLWQRFFQDNVIEHMPHKENPAIAYGVYTEYASDYNTYHSFANPGDYTLIAGTEVTQINKSDNFMSCIIPAGTYAVFPVESQDKIVETWVKIWQTPLNRTYKADFEKYNLETGTIEIYIGIQ